MLIWAKTTMLTVVKGGSMGPIVCRGLHAAYGKRVGCQGVGGKYTAALKDNGKPKGTTDEAIAVATNMFMTASTKCPKAILTFGGYRLVPYSHYQVYH
jgi:cutinase